MQMEMIFFHATNTPLYSMSFAPSNTGQYAGMCVFIIVLGVIFRASVAYRHALEQRWLGKEQNQRHVVVRGIPTEIQQVGAKPVAKRATTVTEGGVQEEITFVENHKRKTSPWRLTVDIPRALLTTATVGMAYLLMLAVMTMNVGYFISVLVGAFVGEIFFGRHNTSSGH